MADICIAYAREDEAIAARLYELLTERYEVWWDGKIVGRFAEAIERELPHAGCVIAIYSASSRNKDTFLDELRLTTKHGVSLLPVKIDESYPPYLFGSYTFVPFSDWNGTRDDQAFLRLTRKIAEVVPPRKKPRRPQSIASGAVRLPGVFFSISSHETQLEPTDAIQALRVFGASPVLVSAFDLDGSRAPEVLAQELRAYRERGGFVLLDSGNYEASRLEDHSWTPDRLKPIFNDGSGYDWAFCFDLMEPPEDTALAVAGILEAVAREQHETSAPVLPIIHAPKLATGGNILNTLPEVMRQVSNELKPPLIAVPERELGAGIVERAKTVRAIREQLNRLPWYQPLHILGTGNPWSIAVLAAAGADTFDGLEWCRVVIDADSERIHHFQHFDFFSDQAPSSSVATALLQDPSIGFGGKVAFHNLDYFTGFTDLMQKMFDEGAIEAFLTGLLGKKSVAKLKNGVPDFFR
jgi:hypothetical protein